jgi:hypothetical protein
MTLSWAVALRSLGSGTVRPMRSLTLLVCCLSACRTTSRTESPALQGATAFFRDDPALRPSSADDRPIADDDVAALQDLLTDKWTFFLIAMDRYNLARDSALNDAMVRRLELVFADQFRFRALRANGSAFGTTQGSFTPRSWLEAQRVDEWKKITGTLLVPSYHHVLTIEERGKRVVLEGYHEHAFVGADLRFVAGDSRQLALESIVFENHAGQWRVADYIETVWSASER